MRLTKKKAIQITKELWKWLAETGDMWKYDWPKWSEYGEMLNDCPLCEYDWRQTLNAERQCETCPLGKGYMGCYKTAYNAWFLTAAVNGDKRKQYATKFLEQLSKI